MKNKLNYILIGILVSFSFMNSVFAEENTLDFEVYANAVGSTEVVSGSDVSVMVGVKSNTYIHACTFEVSSDNDVEYVSVNQMVGNYGALETEGIIKVVDINASGDAPVDGSNIMKLNYKVNSSGKVTIKTVECSGITEEEKGTYNNVIVDFVVKEKNEDYTLKSVKINDEMVPNFYPEGNNYLIMLENPKFSLDYETSNPDFNDDVVVKFNDDVITDLSNIVWRSETLDQNSASLEIIINDKKTYYFSVNYEVKNLDNTLKSLKINGKGVDLKSGETKYSVKIGKDITSIEINAELNDSVNFKIAEPFVNGKLTNGCSGNTCPFQIEIVPVNDKIGGSSLSYIIEVVKEGTTSSSKPVSKPTSSSKPVSGNVNENPPTGDISMFFMALILIASLVGSVLLYQKNMEGYK